MLQVFILIGFKLYTLTDSIKIPRRQQTDDKTDRSLCVLME